MRWSWVRRYRLMLAAAVLLLACDMARATEYHGVVTFSGQPVPGATVTATQGGKTLSAVTSAQGVYSFADLPDGAWTIEVKMSLFAPLTQQVQVAAGVQPGAFDLKLMTLAEIHAQAKPTELAAVTLAAPTTPAAGAAPAASASASSAAAKTAPKTPAKGSGNPQPNVATPPPPPDDPQQAKAADGFLINGSVNNAATSQFSQNQRFGNGVNNGRRLYTGMLSLTFDNSAWDANQYSLTGSADPKPEQNRLTGFLTLGGPIKIPRIMRNPINFTLQYQWMHNTQATTTPALVPDDDERAGNFTNEVNAAGQPVVVYNQATGLPYQNDTVPISPQAQALLNLYPHANVTGNSRYNYQAPVLVSTHQDGGQFRANKQVTTRDTLFGTYGMQSTRTSSPQNVFPFVDKMNSLGVQGNMNWSHRFGQAFFLRNLFMTLGYQYSRSRNQTQAYFQDRTNISGDAGITGNAQDAMNWGPPTLSFSSGVQGLSDAIAAYNRNQTNMVSLNLQWNHGRHYVQGGGDFRRQESNYLQQQNPRGMFTFTGAATQGAGGVGGSDLADFLLGVPDGSTIATGNPDKYLRQSVYDAFLTDDWRVRPELTLNLGVRWEYGAPMTETQNRLVNLDILSDFSAVAPVLASSPKGPLTGQVYPNSLLRPDRVDGIEPRLAASWLPIPGSSLVVRAGYGIYDDTSVYQQMYSQLAQQSPLSKTLNVQNSSACPLTLANGFINCSTSTANTYAVDPNFHIGYAQVWQLSVQRDLPFALQMTATYLGIKGTRGVQESLPNTYAAGGANPCTSCPLGFAYISSNGNSTHEEGRLQLRRRLRSGFTSTLTYAYSKSLDDDAALGGEGPVAGGATSQSGLSLNYAQNWRNLSGERGLSSFDQRHLLTAQVQYTTGMGLHGGTLMGGWRGAIYREWTVLTNITAGTGSPETPLYPVLLPGTSYTPLRPNATGVSPNAAPPGYFVNPAAFATPAAGMFGNARKGSITGPGELKMDASMARTFRLKDRYSLDAVINATNVLNHVTFTAWNTTFGSTLFGQAASTNQMRAVTGTLRLRF